ncbi:MAG: isoprenylcysteine carboxylmethyltransferase family protein [Chloroflexi bacterium]|nr:isoprenylcysteine carboxylmethyltransferase family protein [Chloroflexota bacterium]
MDLQLLARLVVGASAVSLLIVGLGVLAWEAKRSAGTPVRRDSGPLALVNFVGILGFVAVGLVSAVTLLGVLDPLPEPLDAIARLVGIAAVMAAGLLALWGLRSIGGAMSSQAEIRTDTRLVTTGAFGLVRHPLYLSIILIWAGASVALLSWFMAACTIVLVPLFVARSRLEERLLVDHFGDEYRRYAERVPMLVPWFHGR